MVYTLLNSIAEELQIGEANGPRFLAASLTKLSAVELKSADFQLLFVWVSGKCVRQQVSSSSSIFLCLQFLSMKL